MSPLENKILKLLRHIEHVRDHTQTMGFKLIEMGDIDLGIKLIANGLIHDNSKFKGIEFEGLTQTDDTELLRTCVKQHNQTNPHHPEYWNGIKNMPDLFIAEMVCDWAARSGESGTDFREWIEKESLTRFEYSKTDEVYGKIIKYANLLVEAPLKQIK